MPVIHTPQVLKSVFIVHTGQRKHRRSSRDMDNDIIVLPHNTKTRLHSIFRDVEKEFEALYIENVQLRDRV